MRVSVCTVAALVDVAEGGEWDIIRCAGECVGRLAKKRGLHECDRFIPILVGWPHPFLPCLTA